MFKSVTVLCDLSTVNYLKKRLLSWGEKHIRQNEIYNDKRTEEHTNQTRGPRGL